MDWRIFIFAASSHLVRVDAGGEEVLAEGLHAVGYVDKLLPELWGDAGQVAGGLGDGKGPEAGLPGWPFRGQI